MRAIVAAIPIQIHSKITANSRHEARQSPATVRAESSGEKLQTIAPMELAAQEAMALG
jgi:hypothetical protein